MLVVADEEGMDRPLPRLEQLDLAWNVVVPEMSESWMPDLKDKILSALTGPNLKVRDFSMLFNLRRTSCQTSTI